MMARPAADPAPAPDGAPAGFGRGVALRALRAGRMPSTPRMIAAAGGLALTALAFATGALGSSAPADAGAFFARSTTAPSAAPASAGTPVPAVSPAGAVAAALAPVTPVVGHPEATAIAAPSAAASPVSPASPSAGPSATAPALAGAGAGSVRTGSAGGGTAGSGTSSDDIALLGATGGAFDPLDLLSKAAIVVALLYVTLRVLRRLQGGTTRGAGRIQVLESRPLAAKASLHLVEVGDRRLVVGLTPAGMVSLAELGADDLPDPDPAAQLAGSRPRQTATPPALAGLHAALRGGASFAASLEGALAAVRTGIGGARSRIGSAR